MKICVCGVGNRIRGDDGIGPRVIEALQKTYSDDKNVLLLDAQANPENFMKDIEKFRPDKMIIIDAVEMEGFPGEVRQIDYHTIKKGAISTHKLPLSLFIDFLQRKMKFKLLFVGVQPKTIGFNKRMSGPVKRSIPDIVNIVNSHMAK